MAEEKRFVKAYDFQMYRNNLYNGSIEMLIPNLPETFDKYCVEVKVYGIIDLPKEEPHFPNCSSSEGLTQEAMDKFKRSRRH